MLQTLTCDVTDLQCQNRIANALPHTRAPLSHGHGCLRRVLDLPRDRLYRRGEAIGDRVRGFHLMALERELPGVRGDEMLPHGSQLGTEVFQTQSRDF